MQLRAVAVLKMREGWGVGVGGVWTLRLITCKTNKFTPHTIIHDMRIKMLNMAQWLTKLQQIFSFSPPVPMLIQKSIILPWSRMAALSV